MHQSYDWREGHVHVMIKVGTLCLVTMEKEKFSDWVKLLYQIIIPFQMFTCEFVEIQFVVRFTTL